MGLRPIFVIFVFIAVSSLGLTLVGSQRAGADIVSCTSPSAITVCGDGACSTSSGSGTCSWHGGQAGPNTRRVTPQPAPCPFGSVRRPNGVCVDQGILRYPAAKDKCPKPNVLYHNLICLTPYQLARANCTPRNTLLPNLVCVTPKALRYAKAQEKAQAKAEAKAAKKAETSARKAAKQASQGP